MTSKFEGLPSALLEAMSCGLVPVVPDVGDIGDIVHNEHNGFLVSNLDSEKLARNISELLVDDDKYNIMSNNAISDINNNHTIEIVTKQWDSFFGEL